MTGYRSGLFRSNDFGVAMIVRLLNTRLGAEIFKFSMAANVGEMIKKISQINV